MGYIILNDENMSQGGVGGNGDEVSIKMMRQKETY